MKTEILALLVAVQTLTAAENLQTRLAAAKPGQTVTLPSGEFAGPARLPAGASLKGAGAGKTMITGGLTIAGGSGAQVSDLTLRGAGLTVKDAEGVTIARVRATGGASGFMFSGVKQGRIENCVSDHNNVGIAINGGADCVVVNCTVLSCPELGLSVAASPNITVFNNCIVGSTTCLNMDQADGAHVDHNLYFGTYVGQVREQTPKRVLSAWQYLTGLDKHSVQTPQVEFAEHFTPTSVLPWALDRAVTTDWGATELNGMKAPTTDMLGQKRNGRPDIGAVETAGKPPRPADGEFTISSEAGLKSAGVFTKDGLLVAYLFHNLPLPKGQHAFWLPARDYLGKPIPAGDYDVRVAESDFQWTYLNHVGDNGSDRPMAENAPRAPKFAAFTPTGVLVVQQGPCEDHAGVRGYDVRTGKQLWHMNGTPMAQGIAVDKKGVIYVFGAHNPAKGESRLSRLDSATGQVIPWPGAPNGHVYPATSATAHSVTALGDRLYVADEIGNKVFVITTSDGKVEKSFDVPMPRVVAGDEKNGVLWVLSGATLVALKPDGTKLAESSPVPDPLALAASGGQLAVASGKTGKVHFFDGSDPKQPKPLREVGRGDGPFGAIVPDRFYFQKPAGWKPQKDPVAKRQGFEMGEASLALSPTGEFAVVEARRVLVFDDRGKNSWYTIGVYGNWSKPSFATQNRRMWDTEADLSFWLNEKDGTWQPEAFWDHSALTPEGLRERFIQPLGDFGDGGKEFFVAVAPPCGAAFGPPAGQCDLPVLVVGRVEGFKTIPVLTVKSENGKAVVYEAGQPTGQPLLDTAGKPLPVVLFTRFNYLLPDGDLAAFGALPIIWKRTGLNASGVPVYEGKNYASVLEADWRKELSPYDFRPDFMNTEGAGGNGWVTGAKLSDGGMVIQAWLRNSGGSPGNNGAGTDLIGYAPDGRRRWVHPLARWRGIAGLGTADDITITAVHTTLELLAVDADGLGLGGFCEAPQLYYVGYWIDHPNLRLFKMPDGKLHLTYGDNASGRHPWYRLDNQHSLKKTKQPFTLAADRAAELAALEWKPVAPVTALPAPEIRIPKLAQPLPIDGDLEKWRKAGITPQIVIGPGGTFKGPHDNSAIIRVAYEGQNLYCQILQFDDVPVFYELVRGQCVEFSINGASDGGLQFVVYKNPEGRDIIWRNRFFSQIKQIEFDPAHAPRVIKVLDDAKAVPERAALEALYGVDLSNAKVIVTEFKLPLDKTTYAQVENDIPLLGKGNSFWLGFFVDDNDTPYTDVQRMINWPATFGMFSPKEDGAVAVCE